MNPIPLASTSFDRIWAGLNAGDQEAARTLYEKFIDQLIRLATNKLKYNLGSTADPEDVAHSVFESFFEGMQKHQFEARNWGMVFGLLSHIAFRKCHKRKRAEMQTRRNPGAALAPLDELQVVEAAPGPDEVATVTELLDKALAGLDEDERVMVDAVMGGMTYDAVADQVGLSGKTVKRVIDNFRDRLETLLEVE